MKKVLLVFCVIVSINVANGECPDACDAYDCLDAMNKCKKEYTIESLERAVEFCAKYERTYPGVNANCGILEERKSELEQAVQQKQARYAKCRNGNADACFDIGYEELSKCEEVDCNHTEALTYFSKSCNLKKQSRLLQYSCDTRAKSVF